MHFTILGIKQLARKTKAFRLHAELLSAMMEVCKSSSAIRIENFEYGCIRCELLPLAEIMVL